MSSRHPSARLLVVEDDPAIASVLERGLTLCGWQVMVAEDGLAGRHVWATGAFDLVILDVMLPGLNGMDLCAERRAEGDRTPVMLLTARDDGGYRADGERAGADAYLTKPFAYRDLVATAERLLDEACSPPGLASLTNVR